MAKKKFEIVNMTMQNIKELGMFCKKTKQKTAGYQNKLEWLEKRFQEGLKYKMLLVDEGKKELVSRGFIEYIPGEFAWRGVNARDYLFIHCIWVVGRHKKKGYGSMLLKQCVADAKGRKGVAVLTSKMGHWLPKSSLFIKNGFIKTDTSASNFELYAYKFTKNAPDPKIKPITAGKHNKYGSGVTVLTTNQCPYFPDAVEIFENVAKEVGLPFQVLNLNSHKQAQNNGVNPNGTFAVLYNGQVVTYKYEKPDKFIAILKSYNRR
jgi:hypothetical protein